MISSGVRTSGVLDLVHPRKNQTTYGQMLHLPSGLALFEMVIDVSIS